MCASEDRGLQPGEFYRSDREDTVREIHSWTAPDGAVLRYISHQPRYDRRPAVAFLYLHGIESHSAWFDEAADELCGREFSVYCMDRRGSGLNQDDAGFVSGHIDSADVLLDDVDGFIQYLRERHESVFVIGLSWGGKLAVAHAVSRLNAPDALILITPGIVAQVSLPLSMRLNILASAFARPTTKFPIPITPEMFTHDQFFQNRIKLDPLRLKSVSARFYLESLRLDRQLRRKIGILKTPLMSVFAQQDIIIDNGKSCQLLNQAKGADRHIISYENQVHSIQFDAPVRLVDDIIKWLQEKELLE